MFLQQRFLKIQKSFWMILILFMVVGCSPSATVTDDPVSEEEESETLPEPETEVEDEDGSEEEAEPEEETETKSEPDPECGDGTIDTNEECDDGNTASGDGCSSTCQNEEWTHPNDLSESISPDNTSAETVRVAMDDNGQAIIVWQQPDGNNDDQVFISEYRNGSWTHPANSEDNISPDGQDIDGVPQVAMSDNGDAVVVWKQSDGTNNQVYMSEYREGEWTHPTNLLTDNISPSGSDVDHGPYVAIDDEGNTIVVWQQDDGANNQIYMSEYRNGSWTHPNDLATDDISPDGTDAQEPRVAMDDDDNAIIVWKQDNANNRHIYISEYRNDSWTHPTNLLTDNISPNGEDADEAPVVAMDNNGNAIIAWYQDDGNDGQIFKSEYRSGSWTHPEDLTDSISPGGEDPVEGPKIAMDNNGNAIIAWEQSDGAVNQAFISEYRNGSWNHPDDLTDHISSATTYVNDSAVAMDDNGNAVVVWEELDGSGDAQVFMSEYRNGSWDHPSNASDNISPDGEGAVDPHVAMDNNHQAVIVWLQDSGSRDQIYMSEYR